METTQKVYCDIISLLHKTNRPIVEIAADAGVHFTTLYDWMDGKTISPRLITLIKVAKALGYRIHLTKDIARVQRMARAIAEYDRVCL